MASETIKQARLWMDYTRGVAQFEERAKSTQNEVPVEAKVLNELLGKFKLFRLSRPDIKLLINNSINLKFLKEESRTNFGDLHLQALIHGTNERSNKEKLSYSILVVQKVTESSHK
jgi:hypothetical protein